MILENCLEMNLKGLLKTRKTENERKTEKQEREKENVNRAERQEIKEENRKPWKGISRHRVPRVCEQWHFSEEILHTSSFSELESLIKCG